MSKKIVHLMDPASRGQDPLRTRCGKTWRKASELAVTNDPARGTCVDCLCPGNTVRCFVCDKRPAKDLFPRSSDVKPAVFFCSLECAALQMVKRLHNRERGIHWCIPEAKHKSRAYWDEDTALEDCLVCKGGK